MDIYAPLAERIGMYEFMKEMQTLAFRELEPEAYESITKRLDTLRAGDHDQILKLSAGLEQLPARAGNDRKSRGVGKSASVVVELGGRRIIKQNDTKDNVTKHLHKHKD